MGTLTIIYTPVKHSNGQDLVQVCNDTFENFAGWADGLGKYDRQGTWEIAENWTPAQRAEYARAVQSYQNNLGRSAVKTAPHSDGISHTVTVTY